MRPRNLLATKNGRFLTFGILYAREPDILPFQARRYQEFQAGRIGVDVPPLYDL